MLCICTRCNTSLKVNAKPRRFQSFAHHGCGGEVKPIKAHSTVNGKTLYKCGNKLYTYAPNLALFIPEK